MGYLLRVIMGEQGSAHPCGFFPFAILSLLGLLIPGHVHCDCPRELLWSETYTEPEISWTNAFGVAVDLNGNIVAAGYEYRPDMDQYHNWRIRKYDPAGNLIWSQDYNSPADDLEWAYGVAVDLSGNIVMVGNERRDDLNQQANWRIRKHDSAGTLLWSRDYNSPADREDVAYGVAIDLSGNIVVVGSELRPDLGQGVNWRIRKYDPAGDLLWSHDYDSPNDAWDFDEARGVAVDLSGNIVVVGSEGRSDLNQDSNWRIRKYDPAGNLLWSRDYNSLADDVDKAYGVAVDLSGNIVVVGQEDRPDLNQDSNWRICKYDSAGNLLWSRDYNNPANDADTANGVAVDLSGNIVVVGSEYLPDSGQDTNWRIRMYDPAGDLVWSQDYNSSANDDDEAYGVAVDSGGNIMGVGHEGSRWHIRKYSCVSAPTYPYQGNLRVFPNPFIRSEAVRGTVKFEGMDLGGQVRVYTVRGLLVWEGTVEEPYLLEWNGRNKEGKPVAPGTYLWVAESESSKERGTLIVE